VFTGDCNTQTLRFLGRWFGEMDFRLAKAFQLPGRARFEFQRGDLQRDEGAELPEHDQPEHERERVPHDQHAKRRPDGAARVARDLVGGRPQIDPTPRPGPHAPRRGSSRTDAARRPGWQAVS
jgi:hypothetical protein